MTLTAPPESSSRDDHIAVTPVPADVDSLDVVEEEDLPVRPVRRPFGPLTLVLCALLLAAAAFAGGVQIEKGHVPRPAAASSAIPAGARGGAGGATTGASATGAATAGGATAATVGRVTLIDGPNVYVTDATGTVIKIATTPQSQISVTSAGTVASIKPGDTVTATGPTGADGTVTATSLRDGGAGGARSAGGAGTTGATPGTPSATSRATAGAPAATSPSTAAPSSPTAG
jgi:hypothetical protein